MTIQVTAKDSFVHGQYMLDKGQKQDMPRGIAEDLAKVGLVTYEGAAGEQEPKRKAEPKPANKAAAKPENK
jgi:hypothetical protein